MKLKMAMAHAAVHSFLNQLDLFRMSKLINEERESNRPLKSLLEPIWVAFVIFIIAYIIALISI